jgi:predicted dehydrogenase
MKQPPSDQTHHLTPSSISRRRFLSGAVAASATASSFNILRGVSAEAPAAAAKPAEFTRKIKLGVVGTGGRGGWIANLFKRHGGYEMWGVADYFQGVADACGDALSVDKSRRFSTLSGYKRLIESGIEAIALETPPYFFPEHARAAVEAGLHVYMAKPVAVDVPGCLEIEAAAKKAAANKRCFLVDYQIPTDPHNREVMKMVQAGEIGPVAVVNSHYFAGLFADPAFTANLESRFRSLVWCNDVALGGGYHVNACIHAVDAALWLAGARATSATGASRTSRADPHGDSQDAFSLTFEFEGGLILNHRGKHINDQYPGFDCACEAYGQTGYAQIAYTGRAFLKTAEKEAGGEVENLYEAGAVRNIAAFHRAVVEGDSSNPTVRRSVDGALTTILGREAARRRIRLGMDELLRESRKLDVELKGLAS